MSLDLFIPVMVLLVVIKLLLLGRRKKLTNAIQEFNALVRTALPGYNPWEQP